MGIPWSTILWNACTEHHPKLILIYKGTRCCRCKGCTDRQCAERRGGHAFDCLTRVIVLLLTWLEESRISTTSTDMAREWHAILKMRNFVSRRRLHAILADVTAHALSEVMKDAAAARSLESLHVLQEGTTHVNEAAVRSLDSSIHQVGCAIEVDSSTSSAVASSDGEVGGGRKPKPPAPMGASTALRISKRQRSQQTATVAAPDTGTSDEESEIYVDPNLTAAQKPDAARKPAVVRKPAAHHRQKLSVRAKIVNPAPSPAATEAIAAPKRCHIPDVRKYTCSIEVVMCLLDSMNGIEWNRGNNYAVRTSARTTLLCIFQSSTKPTSPAGLCFVQCGWGA